MMYSRLSDSWNSTPSVVSMNYENAGEHTTQRYFAAQEFAQPNWHRSNISVNSPQYAEQYSGFNSYAYNAQSYSQMYPPPAQMKAEPALYMLPTTDMQQTKNARICNDQVNSPGRSYNDATHYHQDVHQRNATDHNSGYENYAVNRNVTGNGQWTRHFDYPREQPREIELRNARQSIIFLVDEEVRSLRSEMVELREKALIMKKEMQGMFHELYKVTNMISERVSRDTTQSSANPATDGVLQCSIIDGNNQENNIPFHHSNLVHQVGQHDNDVTYKNEEILTSPVEVKRVVTQRPNSDPCSVCPTFTQASTATQRTRKTTDIAQREVKSILPILAESITALHNSECSIDSGYQDISMTSARDRRHASQVVTPASPINESPIEATPDDPATRSRPRDETAHNDSYNLSRDDFVAAGGKGETHGVDEAPTTRAQLLDRLQPPTYINTTHINLRSPDTNESTPKPRAPRKIKSNNWETPGRPVPKHRTVFHNLDTEVRSSAHEIAFVVTSQECIEKSETSTDPTLPPSGYENINQNSPALQRRVKLGVSAISKKSGKGQTETKTVPPNRDTERARNAAHAKKELRRKFAAVFEKSQVTCHNDDVDDDTSVVRRRSMRMMTEFQIFDFPDSSIRCESEKMRDDVTRDDVTRDDVISNHDQSAGSRCDPINTSFADLQEVDQPNEPDATHPSTPQVTHQSANHPHHPPVFITQPRPTLLTADAMRNPSASGSLASLLTEVQFAPSPKRPHQLATGPMLRPKPSFPGVSCDVETNNSPAPSLGCIGSGRSAFTPVATVTPVVPVTPVTPVTPVALQYSPVIRIPINPPEVTTNPKPATNVQSKSKRRVSLPSSIMSNKTNDTKISRSREDLSMSANHPENVSHFQRGYSLRVPKKSITHPSEPPNFNPAPARKDQATVPNTSVAKPQISQTSTKPARSIPKVTQQGPTRQESRRQQIVPTTKSSPNRQKTVPKVIPATGGKKGETAERNQRTRQPLKAKQSTKRKDVTQPINQPIRSEKNTHQYETIKNENNTDLHRPLADNSNKTVRPPERAIKAGSKKSTVAMLRASIMGKKEKPPSVDKRRSNEVSNRSISSSVKKKNVAGSSDSRRKSVESVTKKKEMTKTIESLSKKTPKQESTNLPMNPDKSDKMADDKRMGNADSEVMERFLDAAVASHLVRSPLQKLRSSFRTPRNKNKQIHSSRVKDDMEIAKYPPVVKQPQVLSEQFTYV